MRCATLKISFFTTILAVTLSCATAQGASTVASQPATPAIQDPPKIQPAFQSLFARQVAAAGPKAEGWALFSNSSMGHNGQRWIIRSHAPKNEVITYCLIKYGETACKSSNLTAKEFETKEPTLKAADKLDHIIPVSFDGVEFEYLHGTSGKPNKTKRVVFISGNKPFPAAYEDLVKIFN